MKTLYIECNMGAAGDMLGAALLELLPDPEAVLKELNSLGLPGVVIEKEPSEKCGIRGTHLRVKVHGEEEHEQMHHHHEHHDHEHEHHHEHHHHSSLHDIYHIVEKLPVSQKVRKDVMAVYQRIAEAESHVHGVPVTEIHFHEVGTMDAVADIVTVCLLLERLAPEQIVVSPVHVGSGQVRCAHGLLPVPAPATARLLQDVPIYSGNIRGELCTPTGAALLTHFADRFGNMPVMKTHAIGYGMGTKDFPAANCLRVLFGETEDQTDTVTELACNLDDMTPEAIGFAMEQLLEQGALDVFTAPIGMKKNRPGVLLTVLCKQEDISAMTALLFRHTTTLGIRENTCRRYTLTRRMETAETPQGPVRQKVSTGYGVTRKKYEYEDLAQIARKLNCSLAEAAELIRED